MSIFSGANTRAILAALLLVTQSGAALAQGSIQKPNEQIIVNGSYRVYKVTNLSPHPFNPVTHYMVSSTVAYGDLNLATQPGMDQFWGRVNATARNLCGVLDKVAPSSMSESNDCINTATANAISKVTSALAAALDRAQKVASAR